MNDPYFYNASLEATERRLHLLVYPVFIAVIIARILEFHVFRNILYWDFVIIFCATFLWGLGVFASFKFMKYLKYVHKNIDKVNEKIIYKNVKRTRFWYFLSNYSLIVGSIIYIVGNIFIFIFLHNN